MDSLSLRHFPEYDPPASRSRAASEEIAQHVAEYLSRGGAIQCVGVSATGVSIRKMGRQERVDMIRRQSWQSRNAQSAP